MLYGRAGSFHDLQSFPGLEISAALNRISGPRSAIEVQCISAARGAEPELRDDGRTIHDKSPIPAGDGNVFSIRGDCQGGHDMGFVLDGGDAIARRKVPKFQSILMAKNERPIIRQKVKTER